MSKSFQEDESLSWYLVSRERNTFQIAMYGKREGEINYKKKKRWQNSWYFMIYCLPGERDDDISTEDWYEFKYSNIHAWKLKLRVKKW